MSPAQILAPTSVEQTPAMSVCGQYRIWRVIDRQTGAHVTVTVDTTLDCPASAHLAPCAHRVVGLYAYLPSLERVVRDVGVAHAPAIVRTDAHAAYLWARGIVRAHVALAETLAPLGVALP